MSTNFTPLSSSVAHGKGFNTVLITIALVITILLGAFMWFLVVQKQQEEDRANIPTPTTPQRTIEATVEQAEVSSKPTATPSVTPTAIPTAVPVTVTPIATPSTLPTSGQATITP